MNQSPSEQNERAERKFAEPQAWCTVLAVDINNAYEIGLSERELRSLARQIDRRAAIAKATGAA